MNNSNIVWPAVAAAILSLSSMVAAIVGDWQFSLASGLAAVTSALLASRA